MSVTLSVQNAWVYVTTLLDNQRLDVNGLEPGLTCANIVLQRMLSAPFIWRFNRSNFSIAIATAGGTDYVVSVPDLGRIETQWLTDANGNIFELKGAQTISKFSTNREPTEVAPVYDDNQGNITFRFNGVPDEAYTAYFDYQRKPPILTSPGETFAPVPDEFGYLFNKGMLAEASVLVNDARFTVWEQEFVAGLLATQDGLDAQAKEIFYNQMLNTGRTATRSQMLGNDGAAGRKM